MFDRFTDAFQGLYKKLSGNASLSERNVADAMAEVKTALLDADVNVEVVDSFCAKVMQDAIGRHVTKSLKPGEEMIGIVHDRLVEVLGGKVDRTPGLSPLDIPAPIAAATAAPPEPPISKASSGPTVVMMCGLQGSGKTTTCGKVAAYLKKRGRSVMVAAADLQRPAAVEQLQTVTEHVKSDMPGGASVQFYGEPDKVAAYGKAVGVAVQVCQRAYDAAKKAGVDVLILDTAGRLHVNDELMGELTQVKQNLKPHHIFLVVDAMTGQDALRSAKSFHDRLSIDGVILTKFDSDTRGGAAISVRHVTGAPIKFIGTGEKLDALEEFHATRVAGRILGMGDVVSLVEKAQEEVNADEAQKLSEKMLEGRITMDDFLKQMKTLRRMGPLKQLLGMLPGVGQMLKDVNIEDSHMDRVEAMISSMTKKEREHPELIDHSRRRRIAAGSGSKIDDVSRLVKQFIGVNEMSRRMAGLSAKDKVAAMKSMGGAPGMPGGLPALRSKGSSYSSSIKDRFKKRKR